MRSSSRAPGAKAPHFSGHDSSDSGTELPSGARHRQNTKTNGDAMNQEPRATAEEEKEIGKREKLFDLLRNRVRGLDATLAQQTKARDSQYSNVVHDRLGLQIAKTERELAEARAALIEAESRMREGHGWRNAKSAPGE
jgi:TATA-binding protein-associated factor Taf7